MATNPYFTQGTTGEQDLIENIIIESEAEEFVLNVSSNTVKILLNYMEKFKLLNQFLQAK